MIIITKKDIDNTHTHIHIQPFFQVYLPGSVLGHPKVSSYRKSLDTVIAGVVFTCQVLFLLANNSANALNT